MLRSVRFVWMLLMSLSLAGPVAAAGAAPNLDQVVAIALRNSPDLRESRIKLEEARLDRRAAAALPNPVYAITPGNPFQYGASLPLDLGPQRHYRVHAAGLGADAASADARDARLALVFAVRQAYFDLLLADSLRTLAAEEQEIVERLVAADSARARSGDIPDIGLARSSLELAHVAATHARAGAAVHAARLALQLLIGVPPDTGFTVAGGLRYQPLPDLPAALDSLALAGRPDLVAAAARVGQGRVLERLAWSEVLPVPTLSLVHQSGVAFPTGSTEALGISFTVPLLDWNGPARERARAELELARGESQRLRAQIAVGVAVALDQYRTARDLAGQYAGGLLDQARRALEGARFSYQRGAGSLLDLLDALRTYGQTRSDYLTAVHDYWVSAAALSRATGRELLPIPADEPSSSHGLGTPP